MEVQNMKRTVLILAALALTAFLAQQPAYAELSASERMYLGESMVPRDDIAVIPKLSGKAQSKISAWIYARSGKGLTSFKNSRSYFKQLLKLKPGAKLPDPPAGWDTDYLTKEEYGQYAIIASDPVRLYKQ